MVLAGSAVSLHHLPYALIRIGDGRMHTYDMSEALFERIVSRRCRWTGRRLIYIISFLSLPGSSGFRTSLLHVAVMRMDIGVARRNS